MLRPDPMIQGFIELVQGTTIERLPMDKPLPTIIPFLHAWRDYLKGDGPNPVTGEDGLTAVRICDACRQAAIEDRWIEIPDRLP